MKAIALLFAAALLLPFPSFAADPQGTIEICRVRAAGDRHEGKDISIPSGAAFGDAGDELNGMVSDLNDEAMGLKEALAKQAEAIAERERLKRAGEIEAAAKVVVPAANQAATVATLRASAPAFRSTSINSA